MMLILTFEPSPALLAAGLSSQSLLVNMKYKMGIFKIKRLYPFVIIN